MNNVGGSYPNYQPKTINEISPWQYKQFDKETPIMDKLDGWVHWEILAGNYGYPYIKACMPHVMYSYLIDENQILDGTKVLDPNFETILTKHFGLEKKQKSYDYILRHKQLNKPEEIKKLMEHNYFTGDCKIGADFRAEFIDASIDDSDYNPGKGFTL